jgi:putative aminopeptidase FrvX
MEGMELLKTLCSIRAASGDERKMRAFLLDHILSNQDSWKNKPEIFYGDDFQDCIVLAFGRPRTAVFAHMDSIGFTARYKNQLVKIGAPHIQSGIILVGEDQHGEIECELQLDEDRTMSCLFDREIDRGTNLTFKPDWRETEDTVQCCYMDNRLGVWTALEICKTLEDGIIVFSCWEEHGGGSVPYLAKFIHEKYQIRKALISDITWVTDGVPAGKGSVISLRDSGLPRRSFVEQIIQLAENSGAKFQLEVEGSGGSDGNELQKQPYPIDWCFIGPPEENVHTPDEKVRKSDITENLKLYRYLMQEL